MESRIIEKGDNKWKLEYRKEESRKDGVEFRMCYLNKGSLKEMLFRTKCVLGSVKGGQESIQPFASHC